MISSFTKPTLNTRLSQSEERHKLLSKQFADIEKSLTTLEIGTPAYAESAQLATRLKGDLAKLDDELHQLREALKTEQQRQQEADAKAAQQAKALDAKATKALSEVEAAIARINSASDALATSVQEYDALRGKHQQVLRETGKLSFDQLNRSLGKILQGIPTVTYGKGLARLQRRIEAGLRD